MHSNKGKKYNIPKQSNIFSPLLCENIRRRLKLTEKQLPDKVIKKVLKLNGKLIGDWIVNHADGFKIKDNGIIIVSKWLPKCLRGEKLEKIEEIMNNPKNDDYMKEMFKKRYEKSLAINFSRTKDGKKEFNVNLHSFFYLYRVIWFNSRNCAFKKAELYELQVSEEIKDKLNEKIISGRDYYPWNFSDHRIRKVDKLTAKDIIKREENKKKRALKKLEAQNKITEENE